MVQDEHPALVRLDQGPGFLSSTTRIIPPIPRDHFRAALGRASVTGRLILAALAFSACSSSTEPAEKALRPGTYRVVFNIAISYSIPGGGIGDHDLTFRVDDPVSEQSSFTLLSSVKVSRTVGGDIGSTRHDYLDPDPWDVIPASTQWRVQWWYRSSPPRSSLAVRVNISEGDNGAIRLPFGCSVVRYGIEVFQGTGCVVTRIE